MQFSPSFLDELRQRLPASTVIGKIVRLTTKARGEHVGLCPFHNEHTPSFTVSDDKGFYHCFGCGAHGDIIKFTMEKRGMQFTEAVAELASEAGMQLPKPSAQEDARYQRETGLRDLMEKSAAFFETQLRSGPGREALAYLKGRGLSDETIKTFRLGFSPDSRNALMNHLGVGAKEDAIACGMLIRNEQGDVYDRFRGRVMFPITDIKGRVIAFGGRIMGDGQPKYLNSPETELFKKGQVLFNHHFARDAAREAKTVIAVEGYMDVIALHAGGIKNAVAPLGTALTEQQLQLMWRMANEPVLCMDGDNAGQRAMLRAADVALPHLTPGHSLRFCVLPEKMDPDDVIRKKGADALRELLGKARPLSDVLFDVDYAGLDLPTPESRAQAESRLFERAKQIKDQNVATHYRDYFITRLRELKAREREAVSKTQQQHFSGRPFGKHYEKPPSEAVRRTANMDLRILDQFARRLSMLVLSYPALLNDAGLEEMFSHLEFGSERFESFRQELVDVIVHEPEIDSVTLKLRLSEAGFTDVMTEVQNDRFIIKPPKSPEEARAWFEYMLACNTFEIVENEWRRAQEATYTHNDERTTEQAFLLQRLKDESAVEKARSEQRYVDVLEGDS